MFAFPLSRLAGAVLVAFTLVACAIKPPAPVQNSTVANIGATFLAERLRSDLAREYWRNPETRWAIDCVTEWTAQGMGARLVPMLRSELSEEELREVGEFLRSPTGIGYTERATYRVPRGTLPESQNGVLRQFFNSLAGKKLVDPDFVARAANALKSASAEAITACRARYDAAPKTVEKSETVVMKPSENPCTVPQVSYPTAARRAGHEGTVVVRLWLNETGLTYLTLVARSSGDQALDDAAEQAVRTIRCRPFVENGKAMRAVGQQPIAFKLQ